MINLSLKFLVMPVKAISHIFFTVGVAISNRGEVDTGFDGRLMGSYSCLIKGVCVIDRFIHSYILDICYK